MISKCIFLNILNFRDFLGHGEKYFFPPKKSFRGDSWALRQLVGKLGVSIYQNPTSLWGRGVAGAVGTRAQGRSGLTHSMDTNRKKAEEIRFLLNC